LFEILRVWSAKMVDLVVNIDDQVAGGVVLSTHFTFAAPEERAGVLGDLG
jgi:hypothetical protein